MNSSRLMTRLSLGAVLAAGLVAAPAEAMSAKECHAAFQAAKADKSLNGQSYKAFKAAKCGDESAAEAPATTAPAAGVSAAPTSTAPASAPASASGSAVAPTSSPAATKAPIASKSAPAPVAAGNVVFPTAIAPEFSKLSAGKARLKTCAAQYNANKANGGNGKLVWIQRGGGYWSQCNTKLKTK